MIYRVTDPQEANRIYGKGDVSPFVNDKRCFTLTNGEDIAIFAFRGPGIFEGHLEFKSRGRAAIRQARAMLDFMRDAGARMIWGPTPVGLRNVRWFQRQLGFVSHGVMETPEGDCELFVMEFLCQYQ